LYIGVLLEYIGKLGSQWMRESAFTGLTDYIGSINLGVPRCDNVFMIRLPDSWSLKWSSGELGNSSPKPRKLRLRIPALRAEEDPPCTTEMPVERQYGGGNRSKMKLERPNLSQLGDDRAYDS
jgi:hypothetical protein